MLRFSSLLLALVLVVGVGIPHSPAAAQSTEPVVETDPTIPTVNQSVTITFNADQGTQGLQNFEGEVYAHTGVFTDQSPSEWTCVKNYWPTDTQHAGNRTDTRMERVGPNTYTLTIDDIRAYYNDNSTGCTLGADETIQTMNFVFRNADGSMEGKADGGDDIIIELGDASGGVSVRFTQPASDYNDPILANQDRTVTVEAAASAGSTTITSFRLLQDGSEVASSSGTTLTYDLALNQTGRTDLRAVVEGDDGSTAEDSLYAVRNPPVTEQARPSGLEDGINYYPNDDTKVTLSLLAPRKEFVYVVGDFSDWEVDPAYFMNRDDASPSSQGRDSVRYWITIDNLNPGQEYRFQYYVDGEVRIPDPYSGKVLTPNDQFIESDTYPNLIEYPSEQTDKYVSVLETGQTPFNFSSFERPPQKDLVIYELLVRDFIEAHNYQTMQDTLAYLDRLGVNAIELMPVSEFEGNLSWGYNPAVYFATDKYYGPAEELKRFIDMAHQRGIAVILDVVYNQGTGRSPFVRLFNDGDFGAPTADNPWVNREAKHPFNVFYDNNHESTYTKYWLDRANEYWLTEFNVDGFRFDLSKGFTQTDTGDDVGAWSSYDQSRIDILQRMADQIWSVDSDAYVILEHFAASDEERVLAEYKTDQGFPGMMLWNNMNEPYSESAMGYEEGSGLSNTYYRNRGISVPNYITYMESHDEQWMMYRNIAFGNSSDEGYDITELETALNRQKLAGAFFFTVPGPRMMWQFGELGYGYGDNGEQCLRSNDCPSVAPGRTDEKPIRWDYRDPEQSPNRVKLYKTWSALINLRNAHEVFTSTDTQVSLRVGASDRGRRIGLQHASMDVVVAGNFDVDTLGVSADFPSTGTWYDFFTGTPLDIDAGEQDAPIPMAPGEFHIYTSEPVATPEAGIVPYDAAAPPPDAPTNLEASLNVEDGAVELSWTASTAGDVIGYDVYRGTTAAFDTTGSRLVRLDASTTSYTDADIEQGQVYYYRVVARDNDAQRSALTPPVEGFLYPQNISLSVSRSFGEGQETTDYRLIALPGAIEQDLDETFEGSAGDAWQAYWDDGSDENYLVRFEDSNTFRLTPGRGFWAISESAWSVDGEVSTVTLQQTDGVQGTDIELHAGWNIISNPFDKAISWSDVEAVNGNLQPLWRFEGGSFRQTSTFASARSGEAFYFNNRSGMGTLTLPYTAPPSSASARAPVATTAESSSGALLTLTAERSGEGTASVRLGTARKASDGVGPEDVIAPPHRFEALSLQVEAQQGGVSPRQRALVRSIREAGTGGQTYRLTLHAEPGASVRLSAENATALGPAVRLVNRATGEVHDLQTRPSITVQPQSQTTELALLAGSASFVERKQSEFIPDRLKLWPAYPNPFRQQTTIEYTLPEAGDVTLEVYNILGRRVKRLVDTRQPAGLHRVQWDGRTSGGQLAASGLYIARITVDGTHRTRKVTLVR